MIFAVAGKSGQAASDSADDFLTVPAFCDSAQGIVATPEAATGLSEAREAAGASAEWRIANEHDNECARDGDSRHAQFIPLSN